MEITRLQKELTVPDDRGSKSPRAPAKKGIRFPPRKDSKSPHHAENKKRSDHG